MPKPQTGQSGGRRRPAILIAAAVATIAVALAAVYGIGGFPRNAADQACQPATRLARSLEPLVHGEVAALATAEEPLRIPDLAFRDSAGQEHRLSEWRGRTVLFNLWATWCVPCRQEMPALAALQRRLGGERFEVVAVNIDTRDPEKPKAFMREVGADALTFYADASAKVFQDLKMIGRAIGMPTTLLVDAAGCEIGTMAGPAEWASPEGVRLVEAALGAPTSAVTR